MPGRVSRPDHGVVGMRRLFLDIAPLRQSPAFRRLWIGGLVSAVGTQMTSFAVALQVYRITHSSVAVGGVGLAIAVPAVSLGLVGGSVADAFDRRRLVLGAGFGLALVSAVFAVQAFAGSRHVWLLYFLVALQSLLNTVRGPAGGTFMARLLPAKQVPAGAALNMLSFHASVTVGPALAGVLTAAAGLKTCYLIDALSFAAGLYGVARLPPMAPEGGGAAPGLRAVRDGIAFIWRRKVLAGALLSDVNATLLGMPIALFPAINAARFGGSPQTLGLLAPALAVGGILGSTLSGPVGHVARPGRALLIAGAAWGAALAGFGFASSLWLTLLMLALAGAADVTSVVFRSSIIQTATPDRYRGRVNAADYVVGAGFPQLGNFRAGLVGSLTTPATSAASGGIATVIGAALIGLTLPALTHYRARHLAGPDMSGETAAADA